MKLVIAYIKPIKLSDVIYALHDIVGIGGVSFSEGLGFGGWLLRESQEQIERESENTQPHKRLEVYCEDDLAPVVMDTICRLAHTGRPGDGIVFATEASACRHIGASP